MVDYSNIDVVIDGECVVSITVEISTEYLNELGTADEFNNKLRSMVMQIIQETANKRHVQ